MSVTYKELEYYELMRKTLEEICTKQMWKSQIIGLAKETLEKVNARTVKEAI